MRSPIALAVLASLSTAAVAIPATITVCHTFTRTVRVPVPAPKPRPRPVRIVYLDRPPIVSDAPCVPMSLATPPLDLSFDAIPVEDIDLRTIGDRSRRFPAIDLSPPPREAGGIIPEPSTWAQMVVGFGLVGGSIRRARKAAA